MIEQQLRALADDLDGRQSPITVEEIMSRSTTRTSRESADHRVLTLVAAAAVVVVGILGVAAVAVDRSEPPRTNDEVIPTVSQVSPTTVPAATTFPAPTTVPTPTTESRPAPLAPASTVPAPVGFPTTPTTNPPTSAARADVSWWIPTALPDDLSFRYALDWTGHYREMLFGSGDCSPACDRSVLVTTEDFAGEPTGEVVLGGRVWNTTRSPGSMLLRLDEQSVMLRGENLTSEELAEIAAGLRMLPETELPRLPLVCCPYTRPDGVDPGPVVTHIELDTPTGVKRWDLHAYTDGAQFSLSGINQSVDVPGVPSPRCRRSGPSSWGCALPTTRRLVYPRARP
jgi:hypothetical protein